MTADPTNENTDQQGIIIIKTTTIRKMTTTMTITTMTPSNEEPTIPAAKSILIKPQTNSNHHSWKLQKHLDLPHSQIHSLAPQNDPTKTVSSFCSFIHLPFSPRHLPTRSPQGLTSKFSSELKAVSYTLERIILAFSKGPNIGNLCKKYKLEPEISTGPVWLSYKDWPNWNHDDQTLSWGSSEPHFYWEQCIYIEQYNKITIT